MRIRFLYRMMLVLAGVIFIGWINVSVREASHGVIPGKILFARAQQVEQTPVSTESPSIVAVATPQSRQLPPVGSNAGLVIGASVLVLIIIGGVLGSRRKPKH